MKGCLIEWLFFFEWLQDKFTLLLVENVLDDSGGGSSEDEGLNPRVLGDRLHGGEGLCDEFVVLGLLLLALLLGKRDSLGGEGGLNRKKRGRKNK